MKIPARIIAPVVVALLCTVALGGALWWQLKQTTTLTLQQQTVTSPVTASGYGLTPIVTEVESSDSALIALRRGDIAALRGDWATAAQYYQLSVNESGGIPALRKLAQAQLQIRDIEGIADTIKDLRRSGASNDDVALLESIVNLRQGEMVKAKTILEAAADSPQKHYGLALLAIVEGNHAFAQNELSLVTNGWEPVLRSHAKALQAAYDEYSLFPESPNSHLITLLSRALAQVQQCELALPLLAQVTSGQGDYRDAWIVQGYCELTTGRSSSAVLSLERAYNLDPEKPETQYFLGRAHLNNNDTISAITFFEYALANGFEPAKEVRFYLASAALEIENLPLAFTQYSALLEEDDPDLSAYDGYVRTALAGEQPEAAYAAARQAAERYPKDAVSFVLLGKAAAAQQLKDEAQDAYDTALEIDPTNQEAQTGIEALENITTE